MESKRTSQVSRLISIVVLWLFGLAVQAAAQTYPERVVRIINPYPPGGSVDVMARILAQKLTDDLGQQVIVENRSGGGGNTGSDFVAKAEPDGYTLLFTAPGPLTVNQTLYSKLPFDPAKDFAPVALFATAPIVLIVNPGVPANGVQELIALAKNEPGKLNFASAGNGTTNHLSGELFKSMANIDIVHVPYRSIKAVQTSPFKSSGVGQTLDAAENMSIFVQYVPARSSPVHGTIPGQRDRHGPPPPIIKARNPH